jgi:predicted transcriptional regulator
LNQSHSQQQQAPFTNGDKLFEMEYESTELDQMQHKIQELTMIFEQLQDEQAQLSQRITQYNYC